MWQALFDELESRNFVVLAVAMDQPEAARPWVQAAKPAYPCLIDRDHHVADLYGLVNVPQAVWIDESGRIVRPPETAGSTDGFRAMDRTRFTMPDDAIAVVEDGRVVEHGTHDELIELGGRYRTMFDLQASRFMELDDAGNEVTYEQL